jgi:hypothetical protein
MICGKILTSTVQTGCFALLEHSTIFSHLHDVLEHIYGADDAIVLCEIEFGEPDKFTAATTKVSLKEGNDKVVLLKSLILL